MKSFLEDYGLIIVAVIVVQFQKALTDTISTFFEKSGANSSFILLG